VKTITSLDNYTHIDTTKEPEVIIPVTYTLDTKVGSGTLKDFVEAVPYFIRKVYYAGADEYVKRHLLLQLRRDGIVFSRPTHEVAIILTSACNLACANCNMLSNHTSTTSTMTLDTLSAFISDYTGDKADTVIRITGGEPTILGGMLDAALLMLHEAGFGFITVLTNGIKDYTFPSYVSIENSAKEVGVAPMFNTQYIIPAELQQFDDMPEEIYAGGCLQADVCGVTIGTDGTYFPCATGASIYELLYRANLVPFYGSIKSLEYVRDTRHTFFSNMCKYCGMFKKGGYHDIDGSQFNRAEGEEPKGAIWDKLL